MLSALNVNVNVCARVGSACGSHDEAHTCHHTKVCFGWQCIMGYDQQKSVFSAGVHMWGARGASLSTVRDELGPDLLVQPLLLLPPPLVLPLHLLQPPPEGEHRPLAC